MPVLLRAAALVSMVGLLAGDLEAQEALGDCLWPGPAAFLLDRPSPPDSVIVAIANGGVKVCFSRPSARGRTVFGDLVPYGRLWRTGANEPTVLHLSREVEVAGVRLGPGRYVVLTIPQVDSWTIIFSTSDAPVPAQMFEDRTEVARASAAVEHLDTHVEAFQVRGIGGRDEGALILEWERTRVLIPIRRPS